MEQLLSDETFSSSKSAVEGLKDMQTLLKYCKLFKVDKVSLRYFTLLSVSFRLLCVFIIIYN